MLPLRHRLRRSADVQRVRHEGQRWQHPYLILLVRDRPSEVPAAPRIAFIAGRRIGNAVERNRVKRRLRETVRPYLTHIRPGVDLLFIARTAAVNASYRDLEHALRQLLKRSGLWIEVDRNDDGEH